MGGLIHKVDPDESDVEDLYGQSQRLSPRQSRVRLLTAQEEVEMRERKLVIELGHEPTPEEIAGRSAETARSHLTPLRSLNRPRLIKHAFL